MLNIQIQKDNAEYFLKMSGHCGYSEEGRDIVCAAASILCLSLVSLLENDESKLKEPPRIIVEKGLGEIAFHPKEEYSKEFSGAFLAIETGLELLEKAYPEYVSIISAKKPNQI